MAADSLVLSNRLARVAAYVTPGERVIDVGTDHAYVPIWLLRSGVCGRAFATDKRAGPLARAASDARKWGVDGRLTLRLCDGLSGCAPEDVDTVLLAGMGGDTIRSILAAAPWSLEKRLVLQPQTHPRELERWLGARGVGVADMALACDAGRIYAVWLALPGAPVSRGAVHPSLLQKRDPLLRPWLEDRIRRGQRRLLGLEQARQPDPAAVSEARTELEELQSVLASLSRASAQSPIPRVPSPYNPRKEGEE